MPVSQVFDPQGGATGGGGSSPSPSPGPSPSNIIAEWDFSKIDDVDLLAGGDGNKTLDPTTGATGKSFKLFNAASNTGANAMMAVDNGELRIQSDGVTSLFGKSYWGANHTPFLAIKLDNFSNTLAGDPLLQRHTYVCEMTFNAGPSQLNPGGRIPTYQYLHVGIVNKLSSYSSGVGAPDCAILSGPRTTSSSIPQGVNGTYIYNANQPIYFGYAYSQLNNNSNEPGWRDFGTGGSASANKYILKFDQMAMNIWADNDSYRRSVSRIYTDTNKPRDQQPIGDPSRGASNDLWLFIAVQQSFGNVFAGNSWDISKITIKELVS